MLLGGDFNCVLEAADSTGHGSFSRSLATLVQGYALRDAWQARPDSHTYIHHTLTERLGWTVFTCRVT